MLFHFAITACCRSALISAAGGNRSRHSLRTAGVDDHARAEALSFSWNDRIQRAAPAAPENLHGVHRVGAAAHGPENIVDIEGVDIVIDDNDIPAQIGCALALAGNQRCLARRGPDSAGVSTTRS